MSSTLTFVGTCISFCKMAEGGVEFDAVAVRREAMILGKELELKGKDLTDFVKEAVEDAKMADQRATKRKELEQEIEKKKIDAEREKKKIDAEQEMEKKKIDAETERKKLEFDHERKMETIKAKRKDGPGEQETPVSNIFGGIGPQFKLPKFDEENDNFDAYVARFEMMAESQKWPKDQWALGLTMLLSGKALETVQRMEGPDMLDYQKVKETLMNRFRLTTEGFRYKFRNIRPEKGESPEQFAAKLGNLLNRWIELSHIERSYEGLYDLVKKEQFLNCCSSNMRAFIKEKECKNMQEVIKWSKTYVTAHGLRAFTNVERPSQKGGKFEGRGTTVVVIYTCTNFIAEAVGSSRCSRV